MFPPLMHKTSQASLLHQCVVVGQCFQTQQRGLTRGWSLDRTVHTLAPQRQSLYMAIPGYTAKHPSSSFKLSKLQTTQEEGTHHSHHTSTSYAPEFMS